jgi:hypothetical protein
MPFDLSIWSGVNVLFVGEAKMMTVKLDERLPETRQLVDAAVQALESKGWQVGSRPAGSRNTSARRITKGGQSHLVAIRTSRDTYIGFGPSGVHPTNYDFIVAASVDHPVTPTEIRVHMIPGKEVAKALQRHIDARQQKGDRGLDMNWIPLYDRSDAGGGLGLDFPPIARVPSQPAAGTDDFPKKPIISSPTNQYRQKHFDQLEALAREGKWDEVRAYNMRGIDGYSKKINEYRDALIAANEKQGGIPPNNSDKITNESDETMPDPIEALKRMLAVAGIHPKRITISIDVA